jgi:tetratricopeptide (TPR) repeat protein
LGENSPIVAFQQGNATMIMDLDAFDYTYGDADGPNPAQRDLDALLPRVTRVCVLEGAMFRGRAMGGRVLLDTRDAGAIRELANCLQISEDPQTFGHCHCLGGPTMELYAGGEHVATIGLQHGGAIRWNHWYHDAQLQEGERLTQWLHKQGVDPAQLESIYHRGDNFLFSEGQMSSGSRKEAQQLAMQAEERAQRGALAQALELCGRALALDSDSPNAYALRGQIHYQLGRVAEAAADCTAAIDRGFRHAEVYFIRAIALDGAGRLEEALADCAMALHFNPEHAGTYNSRGLIRSRMGKLDEAQSDFAKAIRLAPKWFLPYLNRAQLHHSRRQFDEALADYDTAIDLARAASPPAQAEADATLAILYCRRGDAHYDQFQEEEAEGDFTEARGCHPAAAADYLGDMWLRRNNFGRALEAYGQLVAVCPQEPRGYLGRGLAEEAQGDLNQAAADYSTAIRLQPEGGTGLILRARVRQRQGRADDALADLSAHLRLHPEDAMAYLFRASLHKEQKALTAALEDLNAAHRLAPDDPQVCNNLAWMLATCPDAQLRDGPRAVALARQACLATDWKHAFCMGTLGAALAETGQFDEAIRWQTKALALYPESEKAAGRSRLEHYRAGRAYRE